MNLLLGCVRGATVRNNRFVRTHQGEPGRTGGAYGIDQGSVVEVRRCAEVVFQDNVFEEVGPFAKKRIRVDTDCVNVRGLESEER